MHDPWLERLSDSIDGALDEQTERELRRHIAGCSDCRTAEAELRAVLEAARSAPDREPARDLWPGIEAAIRGSTGVIDLAARRPRTSRRFSFSMPQLAAAAVVLMAISGGGVWLLRGAAGSTAAESGTVVQAAGDVGRNVRMVDLRPEPQYTGDIAALEAALEANRDRLDPATIDVIERSLESIDRAIEEARAALDADPGNPYLHRQLDNTMRKKVDVLRLATRVQRAES